MQNYNWDLMTQFVFPEEYGIVEEVVSVDIKPRWQQIETEDSLRLVGIYHITSTVRFNPKEFPEYSEGTLIEHLEMNGNEGYFEYALPLEVNLPKEKVQDGWAPQLNVEDVNFFVYDGSSCTFKWDICCTISEKVDEVDYEFENEFIEPELPNLEYIDSSSLPLDIPSVEAFSEMIEQPPSYEFETNVPKVQVEPEVEPSYEESYSNYFEPEKILQTTNVLNPEEAKLPEPELLEPELPEVELAKEIIEELPEAELTVDDAELQTKSAELVEAENILLQERENEEPSTFPFEEDDFFADLTESYTLLDLRSNKINPE